MKIYKIAQNFEMIPQDPAIQNDPNVQLQNLQSSQSALQYFKELIQTSEKALSDLRALEEQLGMGDIGLVSQTTDMIKVAASQTPAFNLLAQMNLISSIDNLLDQNELSTVENLILTNISSISSQYSTTQSESPMGGPAI